MISRSFAFRARPIRQNTGAILVGSSRLRRNREPINGTARPTIICETASFDAQDWFNDYFGIKEPALRQNDFGGTFGGPVRIPHLYNGKDKTFFFVSYEGLRLIAPQPATLNYVPDATLRASTPAPLNQVLNAFPVPESQWGYDTRTVLPNSSDPGPIPVRSILTSVRFDHAVNDRLRIFFRFSDTGSNSASAGRVAAHRRRMVHQFTLCGHIRLVQAAALRAT